MKVLSFTYLAEGATPLSAQLGGLVDTATIAGGISVFVPVAVAFITKREASDRVKSIVNLFAVAVASVVALFINGNDGQPLSWQTVAATFVTGLVSSLAAYKGFWKPVGVTPKIAGATENFGVGTPVPAVAETARPSEGGVQ